MVHRKKESSPVCAASFLPYEPVVAHETGAAPLMNWDDVKMLLTKKFTAAKLETALR